MEKFLVLMFTALQLCNSFAQIPNNDFEVWTTSPDYSSPANWDNLNSFTSVSGIYTCNQGPAYSGASGLFLTTKLIPGKGVVPGVAVCGIVDTLTYKAVSGFPFTDRPQYLSYYLQHMPYDPSDSSIVKVLLTKWNISQLKRDTIAFGMKYYNSMAHSWFMSSTTLNYYRGDAPDSAIIVISSSGSIPRESSYIYIDNLQFVGNVIGINEYVSNSINFSVFPNPAITDVIVELEGQVDPYTVLNIFDILGKVAYSSNVVKNINSVPLSLWKKGIYFVEIKNNQRVINKRLIIN